MNNLKTKIFTIVFSTFVFGCEKETIIPNTNIPTEIKEFTQTHFPNNSILQLIKDKDIFSKTYDLLMDKGISLEFNRNYKIIGIDSDSKLPDSVIPEKLRSYVNTNYSGSYITDWNIDGNIQQIQLNNGLELDFNLNGDFVRIDP